MEFSLDSLQPKERASFALRALYEAAGCRKYHMGRFCLLYTSPSPRD